MNKFSYLRPATISEACGYLQQFAGQAKVVAGGTDLLVQLREEDSKLQGVTHIIDLTYIQELNYIKEEGDRLTIGPLCTHSLICQSPVINKEVPILAQAALQVGAPQIRSRGTIGGNVMNASPAADTVPVLVALDAVLTLTSAAGERQIPIAQLYAKPYETIAKPEELLTAISFVKLPSQTKSAFIKLGRRNALAIARMNVAVFIVLDDTGKVEDIRIAPGSVMPTPQRISSAEAVLFGKVPNEELIAKAGKSVAQEMIAKSGVRQSTRYKEPVIENLTIRALNKALGVNEDE